mgnify:CR=1 FL=1
MDDIKQIKEMLKAVLNGQHTLRAELMGEISSVRKEMHERFEKVDKKFEKVDKRFDKVDGRLDTLGKQVAYLEDDAPTREEHTALEKRVETLEAN